MQDIRLPSRRGCGRRSSRTLHGVGWQSVTDGSGKRIVPTFTSQDVHKALDYLHHATRTVHGRTEEISTILTAVMFAGFRRLGGAMKEEPLAPAVGFGLILQKTTIMSRYTLNLQTPH